MNGRIQEALKQEGLHPVQLRDNREILGADRRQAALETIDLGPANDLLAALRTRKPQAFLLPNPLEVARRQPQTARGAGRDLREQPRQAYAIASFASAIVPTTR